MRLNTLLLRTAYGSEVGARLGRVTSLLRCGSVFIPKKYGYAAVVLVGKPDDDMFGLAARASNLLPLETAEGLSVTCGVAVGNSKYIADKVYQIVTSAKCSASTLPQRLHKACVLYEYKPSVKDLPASLFTASWRPAVFTLKPPIITE